MPSLPANATEISRASYRVAQDLAERLEYVFLAPEPEQRVLTMLELIRDTLELLPEIPSVIRARSSIAQCLAASPE